MTWYLLHIISLAIDKTLKLKGKRFIVIPGSVCSVFIDCSNKFCNLTTGSLKNMKSLVSSNYLPNAECLPVSTEFPNFQYAFSKGTVKQKMLRILFLLSTRTELSRDDTHFLKICTKGSMSRDKPDHFRSRKAYWAQLESIFNSRNKLL